jgi:DNA-binding LacI/PurR family transcriptional regulator
VRCAAYANTAGGLLLADADGGRQAQHQQVVFQPELVIRESA